MTTEEDFQAALDANPDDWQTRLVLADFLQERGDPRAAGYRALGALRRWPHRGGGEVAWWGFHTGARTQIFVDNRAEPAPRHAALPGDWMFVAVGGVPWMESSRRGVGAGRRGVEDAAALAFAKLPAARRAELLDAPPG